MSHHLLSKKLWVGIGIMTCTFLAIAYAWFDYADHSIIQTEIPNQEMKTRADKTEPGKKVSMTEEAALYAQEPIRAENIEKIEEGYPCMVQMKQENIGLYTQDGTCIRQLIQVGEWLSEADKKQLQQGLWVESERELIMVLESYHLQ